MSYEKLKKYVDEQRSVGADEANIREALEEKHWAPELIDKAFSSDKTIEENDHEVLPVKALIKRTWNSFTTQAGNYILAAVIASMLPLIPILLFALPICYDVYALHFTARDFLTTPMLPLMVIYVIVCAVLAGLAALWGNLALSLTAVHNGELKIDAALSKAWSALLGYVWVNILVGLVSFACFLPLILLISLFAFKISYTPLLVGTAALAFIGFIVAIIVSFMLFFSAFAYIVHGARGMTALRASNNLMKVSWKWVIPRLLLLWVMMLIASGISQLIPILNVAIQLLITPLIIIYTLTTFKNAERVNAEKSKAFEQAVKTENI